MFVEFPALVAGEESPFAAHLTRLSDHFAIDSGTVVVELTGGGLPIERFSVDHPSVAGIFRPIVLPAQPGRRTVTLHLTSPSVSETHEMGEFDVFPTREEADAAAPEETETAEEISYLLEQQWRVPFRVQKVVARSMRPNFPAFASLVQPPDAEASVMAPRDGRIVAVGGRLPVVGQSVSEGEVLFELTSAPTEGADPATLDLEVDQAQIRVEAAEREVERLEPLVESGVVPRRRFDEAQSELATAQAQLRGARRRRNSVTQTEQVGGTRDALAVPSPIDGVIAELFVSTGAWVSEGDRLARVVNTDRLLLRVAVPEAYIGRIGQVSGAWFQLDNVSGTIEVPSSALSSIGAELDRETRTLPIDFSISNIRRDLFAGMRMEAHLIADQPVLTVAAPLSAVIDDAGMNVVFVQTGGESFERRPVRLGIRDGDFVEVTEGLAPGEWVVTAGAYSVKLAASSTESIGHGHAH
ncbi:MAG: efflux RND transporter periplasmic adaptor subunit [Myxococcales bacterium]|nr:efflux RND transporter periplasmic adaptor subunit [Myxococcales bacterium]